jgi:ParB family chromosome partitioning protein
VSKLSEKFAAGKKAVADRAALAAKEIVEPVPAPFPRAAGPLHGSVSTMKIDMLKSEVEKLRAGKPEMKIAANEVRPSVWANRHEDSFKSAEFEALKAEIKSAGGNIQPIKVRPIRDAKDEFKYEVVFGHRRHRACLELGLDVLAIVEVLDDKHLFIEMDRENRQRADLRPYEQGLMYARALDQGLFSSIRKLAEDVGADSTNVSRAVALARLPAAVLNAFESRLDIQYRWVPDLKVLVDKEPDVVLARAAEVTAKRAAGALVPSQAALNALLGNVQKPLAAKAKLVKVGNRVLTISERNNKVSFEVDALDKDKIVKIEKFIADLMID